MEGRTLARKHDAGAEIEPWPQQRMGQVCARFIDGVDAVKASRRGSAETGQLRKDEPHPVSPLPPRAQFGEHGFEDRFLGRYEALQIEAIVRCHRKLSLLTRRPRLGNSFGGSASSIQVGA